MTEEVRSAMVIARSLPADGIIYSLPGYKFQHLPLTSMKMEQAFVERDGLLWRQIKSKDTGNWRRIEQVAGSLSHEEV